MNEGQAAGSQVGPLTRVFKDYLDAVEMGKEPDRPRIEREFPELIPALQAHDALRAHSPPPSMAHLDEARPAPPTDLTPGTLVEPMSDFRFASGYTIVEKLGSGGAGVVYRVRLPQEVVDRADIAVKFPIHGQRLEVSKRVRDLQILKGFRHPNLVNIYAAGASRLYGPFVASEYVEGCDLADWVRKHGALGEREAAEVMDVLAGALHALHEQGINHCDVKPQNVFGCGPERLEPEKLKIGDLGLGRFEVGEATRASGSPRGETGGTTDYMAPEQFWGEYDRRADIYAFGITMLRLVTSERGGPESLGVARGKALERLRSEYVQAMERDERRRTVRETFSAAGPLDLTAAFEDPQLRSIVAKCIAFEASDRYQNAGTLAEDLGLWLERRRVRHAAYAYRPAELLRMLIDRCRDRDDVEDHSKLWGLVCLLIGPFAIILSALSTTLVLLGCDPIGTRWWTAGIYIAIWLSLLIPTSWITRQGRRRADPRAGGSPIRQLVGYMLVFLVCTIVLRLLIFPDQTSADMPQFLITGVILSCVGLSSRDWKAFFYMGILLIIMAWPFSYMARQPWYDPFGSVLLGTSQGICWIAFGWSYLRPSPAFFQSLVRK